MSLRLEMSEPGRQYVLLADKDQAQGNARGLQHLQGGGHNDIRTDIAAHAIQGDGQRPVHGMRYRIMGGRRTRLNLRFQQPLAR